MSECVVTYGAAEKAVRGWTVTVTCSVHGDIGSGNDRSAAGAQSVAEFRGRGHLETGR